LLVYNSAFTFNLCRYLAPAAWLSAAADEANPRGWTAAHFAAMGGHVECLVVLVDAGANLNVRCRDPAERAGLALPGVTLGTRTLLAVIN
jgi:hypothetical protein